MYINCVVSVVLFFCLSPQSSEAADDNPITTRFHCQRGCCDHHEWCRFWSSVGECKNNREWMADNCQLACGTCKRGSTRTPPLKPLGVSPSGRPPNRTPNRARRPLPPPPRTLKGRRPPTPEHVQNRRVSRLPRPQPAAPVRTTPRTTPFFRATRPPRTRPQQSLNDSQLNGADDSSSEDDSEENQPLTTQSQQLAVEEPRTAPQPSDSARTPPVANPSQAVNVALTQPSQPAEALQPRQPATLPANSVPAGGSAPKSAEALQPIPPAPPARKGRRKGFRVPRPAKVIQPASAGPSSAPLRATAAPVPNSSASTSTSSETVQMTRALPPDSTLKRIATPPAGGPTVEALPRTRPPPPPPPRTTPRPNPRRALNRQPPTTSTTNRPSSPQTRSTQARAPQSFARCQQILKDPLVAAEEMIRERLVVSVEDNSNRKTVDLDAVIRSNLANACVPRLDESNCERNLCYNAYFRTMDGTCNNLQNPLRGAAYRPYTRLLPTVYDNELSEPVASMFPELRPSPRAVTRHLTSSHASVVSEDYNAMIMQFGQFISHDMAKTTLIPSAKCNVCQNITGRCMAVAIEKDDPNIGFRRNTCVRVSRSSPICGSGNTKPRQQLNENSGYIDASPIYGSSVHDSAKFRQGRTGFLKLPSFNGMQMLPFDQSKCKNRNSCTVVFTAGDSRVNLFVGLSAWHTIFTREHNRIAGTLTRLNPHWDGDRLYHEARKIVGAEVQAIVYREWLPKILGAAFSSVVGDYSGYDPSVDATIANEFTSAAFRFGHGMIQEFYQRLDPNFSNSTFGALAFQKGTLHSDVLVNEGGPDPLVRGMFSQNVKRPQRVTTTVTENMFGSTDLSTINIQRGRDHGHPSYTKYRELCGMGVATTFDHLSREILNTATREKLEMVYGRVERIDLWVGALLEDPVVRGLVGPTISCIVGPQFKRTRDGDRFYYENPGVFTRAQLSEIRKSSLSRIICDNSNTITMVPREAFRLGHLTPCSQIPQMDLSKWKE